MSESQTLVIDQGTFATRALILDAAGNVRASAFCEIGLRRLGPDLVEQDADEIIASLHRVIKAVLNDANIRHLHISQAGLATQRSSVVAWDKRNGKPLAPLLSWQDRRAAEWLSQYNTYSEKIKKITGLPLSPHYGASKLRWYVDHIPEVKRGYQRGYLALGPLASFLLFHLLREKPLLVDHANASRTQLWNINTRDWDTWLLDLFGVPHETLPHCLPICDHYGDLKMADIPLMAVNGDQTSAIYALGRPAKDTAIVNIGTGAFILLPTGKKWVHHPTLLSGLSMSRDKQAEYIIEGTVNGAGAAINWAAEHWHIADMIENISNGFNQKGEIPLFINSIGGLGSPWWRPGPSPKLLGNGESWQKGIAVAESILFLLRANLDAMLKAGLLIRNLRISGGLARLDGLCQRLADLTQMPVYRPAETEATARGIAWLASGFPHRWPKPGRGRSFKPRGNLSLNARYQRFRRILQDKGS